MKAFTRQPTHSLRGRLLSFVLVAIFLAALAQGFTAYRGALQQADAMFDDHLQQVARSMRNSTPLGMPLQENADETGFDFLVQIWGQDGTQLFRSTHSALPPRAVLGFSDVHVDGTRFRVYSLQTSQLTVQIAQDLNARAARAQALAFKAVQDFLWLTPLLMLAVWWIINRSLAPIELARRQVASRQADDFSPLVITHLPDEVRPLVDELNLLFGRLRRAFDVQNNFVADAAHELRSPLTALKLQAQALRRTDDTPMVQESRVASLNQGIDRAIRLVEQLLTLAREEAGAAQGANNESQVDLSEVITLAVSDVLPNATQKNIDLGLTDSLPLAPITLQGQTEPLRMLLRNLLDNAVKYTPKGGRVDLSFKFEKNIPEHQGSWLLTIEDTGPGIAPEARKRVFDRFFRLNDGLSDTGSGLGLAIVKTIADRYGIGLELTQSERLGGLRVALSLPLSKQSDAAVL